ncbi:MAG: M28 family peptidase [Raineya sp.]|jgi:hypothetical protein|nr:M28 family peptidase [Raineya sp.]
MTRKFVLLIGLLFFLQKSIAQDITRVRKNLMTLCSPTFNGRGYVGKGDSIAAQWIAQEWGKIGLKTFQDSYFQSFTLSVNTFPQPIQVTLGKKQLKIGEDFIVSSNSPSVFGKASIIYLDTLIFDNPERRTKFFQQNFNKKALVYPAKFAKQFSKLNSQEIQKILKETTIWVSLHDKLTASISTYQDEKAEIMVFRPSWDYKTKKISYNIRAKFIEKYTSQNVIGYIQGTSKPDSMVVFTGHYDHLGNMGGACFIGANDNASGISMLMELAHHYTQNPPTHSVVFIAFAAEEAGLIGSKFYTENPIFDLKRIKVLINLDLVGTGDEGITIVNGGVFEKDFQKFVELNDAKKLLPKVVKRGKAANSDHYFFSEKGVKAFFIYTMGGIKAYHDIYDKPETLPLTKYKEVFTLLTDYVKSL